MCGFLLMLRGLVNVLRGGVAGIWGADAHYGCERCRYAVGRDGCFDRLFFHVEPIEENGEIEI